MRSILKRSAIVAWRSIFFKTHCFQGLRARPRASRNHRSSQRFESSLGLESRMAISNLPERSAVPVQHTWDTDSIFPSTTAWEAALEGLKRDLPHVASFAGQLHDPQKLLEFLELRGDFEVRLNKLYVYAGMHSSVDANDSAASAREGQAGALYAAFREASSLLEENLASVERPGFPPDAAVADDAGVARLPRNEREGGDIADRHVVGVVRLLAQTPDGKAGKARSPFENVLEMAGGNRLGFGHAVDIDELSKHELNLVLAQKN